MTERSSAFWILALALALTMSGCSAIDDFGRFMFGDQDAGPPDSGPRDSGVDGGVDAGPRDGGPSDGGLDAGPRGPSAVVQTSGGAVITTPEYRLRVSVGAPQPMGSRGDATHRVRVGPVSR